MNIAITIRNNVSKLITLSPVDSQAKFAALCNIGQKTINKLFISDMDVPSTRTLVAIAEKNNAAPWMLLVESFPFQKIRGKPIKSISPRGFELLQAFENSSEETKNSVMAHIAFSLQTVDGNTSEAKAVMETKAEYKID